MAWCAHADSRRGAGYRQRSGYKGRGSPVVAWAWNAAADGGHPYPFVVREYFNLYDVSYQGHEDMYGSTYAILYPNMAVASVRGYVGGVVSWGGGSPNGTHYYLGSAVFIESVENKSPWGDFQFSLPGQANTTSTIDGGDWGDYNTARPMPDGLHFVAGEWRVNTGPTPTPYVIEFGQARDHNAYLRWANT